jgi:hypothetical protein
MIGPAYKPDVLVFRVNGQRLGIATRVKRALMIAGADREFCTQYIQRVMSGNGMEHMFKVSGEYVNLIDDGTNIEIDYTEE